MTFEDNKEEKISVEETASNYVHTGRILVTKKSASGKRMRLDSRETELALRRKVLEGVADYRAHQKRQDGEVRARSILAKREKQNVITFKG